MNTSICINKKVFNNTFQDVLMKTNHSLNNDLQHFKYIEEHDLVQ